MARLDIIFISIITVSVLLILFYRIRYVRQSKLLLWGVYLLADITSLGLVFATHQVIFSKLSIETSSSIYLNVFLIIQMGITMGVYRNFYQTKDEYLIAVFLLFIVLWGLELVTLGDVTKTLKLATVFSRTVIVIGVWLYFFQIYRNTNVRITEIPFFWIALGWLVYFGITGAAYIPQISHYASVIEKNVLSHLHSTAEGISRLLYAIAFWKTKKWIENYN